VISVPCTQVRSLRGLQLYKRARGFVGPRGKSLSGNIRCRGIGEVVGRGVKRQQVGEDVIRDELVENLEDDVHVGQ
jgi:hypothetical protein